MFYIRPHTDVNGSYGHFPEEVKLLIKAPIMDQVKARQELREKAVHFRHFSTDIIPCLTENPHRKSVTNPE